MTWSVPATLVPFSQTSPREMMPPLSFRNVCVPATGEAVKPLRYHYGTVKSLRAAFLRFSPGRS
jgi:hypothetical protein